MAKYRVGCLTANKPGNSSDNKTCASLVEQNVVEQGHLVLRLELGEHVVPRVAVLCLLELCCPAQPRELG